MHFAYIISWKALKKEQMSKNLDNINFSRFDPKGLYKKLEEFCADCRDAWKIASDFALPSYYIKANKFVITGMGGSGIAGDIISDLLYDKNVLIYPVHDYSLPGWVDKDTLVIALSYSGNTEETLSVFAEARNKGAKLLGIATDGKLKVLADKFNAPCLTFEYKAEPRQAFPYFLTFLVSIFAKLGHLEVTADDFAKMIDFVEQYQQKIKFSSLSNANLAKITAQKLSGRIPFIFSSGLLQSVGRRIKTQINENAKNFAFTECLPELNHNSITGLSFPRGNNIYVLMLESNFDNERIVKRQNITAKILENARIPLIRFKLLPCESQLSEILSCVIFGDYLSYYFAVLNDTNPDSIKNIEYLKAELEK